jgi:hypothetical protein
MHKIDINFRPSLQWNVLLAIAMLGSIVIILTLAISTPLKVILLTFTAGYGILLFGRHSLLIHHKQAVTGLKLNQDGWFLITNSGVHSVEIGGESTITLFACILRFQLTNSKQKRSCIVLNDSLKSDDYRRLVVHLRTSTAHKADRIRRRAALPNKEG